MVWKIKERGLQKLKHPARLKFLLGWLWHNCEVTFTAEW